MKTHRLVLAILLVGAAAAASARPASAVAPQEREFVYVASQSAAAVTVIDAQSHDVVATVDLTALGYTANCKPHHIAVEADGSFWYVSLISDWRILKFDRDNNLVGQAEFETPGMLSIDPRLDLLYVGRSMAAVNPPTRIGVLQRSSMTIEEHDVFFPRPHAIVASPLGDIAYTASLAENRAGVVEVSEDGLELLDIESAMAHHMFVQFAVSPDGRHLVAGGQMSGALLVWSLENPRVPRLIHEGVIGGQPWHPTFSNDGQYVYFPERTANQVAVVDASTWEAVATITGGGLYEPHGSGLSSDGRWLFVSGRNTEGTFGTPDAQGVPPGTLTVIDTTTNSVVKVIEVPAYAAGVGARAR